MNKTLSLVYTSIYFITYTLSKVYFCFISKDKFLKKPQSSRELKRIQNPVNIQHKEFWKSYCRQMLHIRYLTGFWIRFWWRLKNCPVKSKSWNAWNAMKLVLNQKSFWNYFLKYFKQQNENIKALNWNVV